MKSVNLPVHDNMTDGPLVYSPETMDPIKTRTGFNFENSEDKIGELADHGDDDSISAGKDVQGVVKTPITTSKSKLLVC